MFYNIFNRTVLTWNHLNISTVSQSKYLGIIISVNNCAPDLKRQMCKLCTNVNMHIIRKFSRCSPDVKCFFYLTLYRALYKINYIYFFQHWNLILDIKMVKIK